MRSLIPILLVSVLFASVAIAQDNVIELRNTDILSLIDARVPSDAIIRKIQTSRCHFDTFPTVISELRYRGVPTEILIAMMEAPIGRPTNIQKARTPAASPSALELTRKISTTTVGTAAGTSPVADTTATKKAVGLAGNSTAKSATESSRVEPAKKPATAPTENTPTVTAPTEDPKQSPPAAKQNIDTAARSALEDTKVEPTAKPATTATENTSAAVATPMEKPKESPAPEPKVFTNSDILQLLRGGLATSAVASAIRKARGNYDFSGQALHVLQEAGADAMVLLAMMEVSRQSTEPCTKPEEKSPKP